MRNRWFDLLSLNEQRRLHDAAVGRQRRRAPFQERDSRFHFAQTARPSPNIDGVTLPDVRHRPRWSNHRVRSPHLERGTQLCGSSRPVLHRRQGRAGPLAPRGTAQRVVVNVETAVIECNWQGAARVGGHCGARGRAARAAHRAGRDRGVGGRRGPPPPAAVFTARRHLRHSSRWVPLHARPPCTGPAHCRCARAWRRPHAPRQTNAGPLYAPDCRCSSPAR